MALSAKFVTFTITGSSTANIDVSVGFTPKCGIVWWAGNDAATDEVESDNTRTGFGVFDNAVGPNQGCLSNYIGGYLATQSSGTVVRNDAVFAEHSETTVTGLVSVDAPANWPANSVRFNVDDATIASYKVHMLVLGGDDISNTYVGFGTSPTTATTQDVTAPGFDTDAIFIGHTPLSSAPPQIFSGAGFSLGFGADNGASPIEGVLATGNQDGVTTSQNIKYCIGSECAASINLTASDIYERAEFNGTITNGFRLNWLEVSGTARYYLYLAIAGNAIFFVDTFTQSTLTQSATIARTGYGGTPGAFLVLSHMFGGDTAGTPSDDYLWSIGGGTSTTERGCHAAFQNDNESQPRNVRAIEYDAVAVQPWWNPGAEQTATVDYTSVKSAGTWVNLANVAADDANNASTNNSFPATGQIEVDDVPGDYNGTAINTVQFTIIWNISAAASRAKSVVLNWRKADTTLIHSYTTPTKSATGEVTQGDATFVTPTGTTSLTSTEWTNSYIEIVGDESGGKGDDSEILVDYVKIDVKYNDNTTGAEIEGVVDVSAIGSDGMTFINDVALEQAAQFVVFAASPGPVNRQAQISAFEFETEDAGRQAQISAFEFESPDTVIKGPTGVFEGFSTTAGLTFDTASVQLVAGRLYLLTIDNRTSATNQYASSVQHDPGGTPLSFTLANDGTNDGKVAVTTSRTAEVWWVYCNSTTSSAAIRITFPGPTDAFGASWTLSYVTGAHSTDPWQQIVTGSGNGTSAGVTMAAYTDAQNALIAVCEVADAITTCDATPDAPMVEVYETDQTQAYHHSLNYENVATDTTPSCTLSVTDDWGFIGLELKVAGNNRQAQISAFEFETPNAARQAQISAYEFQTPDEPRQAQVSAFEFETEDAARQAQVSAFEFETENAARQAQISAYEFETGDAARQAQISAYEFEVPEYVRQAQISAFEFETGDAARQAQISAYEFETGDEARQAQISAFEFELPVAARQAQVSAFEFELPDAAVPNRQAQVSAFEFQTPDAARQAQISAFEFELGDAARQAQISAYEFEVPDEPRQAQISAFEFETEDAARQAQISAFEFETGDAARQAQISAYEFETGDAARQAQISAYEFEVPDVPRRAQISAFEFEVGDYVRRAQISAFEFQTPDAPGTAQVQAAKLHLSIGMEI